MVRCANYVVVVADSSKIGHEDFVSFARLEDVDALVTDDEIGDDARAEITSAGIEVVIA